MTHILTQPTTTAFWYDLVCEAEKTTNRYLDTELEGYLVHLLQRFINHTELTQRPMALDYLETHSENGKLKQVQLQHVGDQCLMLSGFFPQQTERRHVNISYYIDLGKIAYSSLSELHHQVEVLAELFEDLQDHFVDLVDLLLSIRSLTDDQHGLSPIQAADLYNRTGSKHALQVLREITDGFVTK